MKPVKNFGSGEKQTSLSKREKIITIKINNKALFQDCDTDFGNTAARNVFKRLFCKSGLQTQDKKEATDEKQPSVQFHHSNELKEPEVKRAGDHNDYGNPDME